MKLPFAPAFLVLILGVTPSLLAAENPVPPSKAEQTSALAGKYVGTWKGPNDSGGTLRLTLKRDSAMQWSAEASFTFESTEVPMKLKTMQVEGAKLVLVFDWAVDGTPGQSTLKGEAAGDKLVGTYQTVTDNPSSGTWTVTRS